MRRLEVLLDRKLEKTELKFIESSPVGSCRRRAALFGARQHRAIKVRAASLFNCVPPRRAVGGVHPMSLMAQSLLFAAQLREMGFSADHRGHQIHSNAEAGGDFCVSGLLTCLDFSELAMLLIVDTGTLLGAGYH